MGIVLQTDLLSHQIVNLLGQCSAGQLPMGAHSRIPVHYNIEHEWLSELPHCRRAYALTHDGGWLRFSGGGGQEIKDSVRLADILPRRGIRRSSSMLGQHNVENTPRYVRFVFDVMGAIGRLQ